MQDSRLLAELSCRLLWDYKNGRKEINGSIDLTLSLLINCPAQARQCHLQTAISVLRLNMLGLSPEAGHEHSQDK